MAVNADSTPALRPPRARERFVDFVPEDVKAPFTLRCGALIIDYIVLIIVPVFNMLLSRSFGNDGAKLLTSEISTAGWIIAILIGVTNFVLLPVFLGQSVGKLIAGLRIVSLDGTQPTASRMLLRQIFGYAVTAATLGIGFLVILFSRKGRALHDYIAGTVVIFATRRKK